MDEKPFQRARSPNIIVAENGACRRSGTALANYSDTPSCDLAQPTRRQPGTWGGARNRADRTSDGLSDKQVAGLIDAAELAFSSDRIFQRHWTVHYGLAGIAPRGGARFVSRLLDLASKQARREGGHMTALWVRECASGKGEHVHILLHLPAGMSLRNRTRRWINAAGGTWRRGVSKVTIVGGLLSKVEKSSEARQRENAENVVRYLLKAASEETGARLDLTRWGRGGRIVGKRCGWTQNAGHGARRIELPPAHLPLRTRRPLMVCSSQPQAQTASNRDE
jgi:hypothetical protein